MIEEVVCDNCHNSSNRMYDGFPITLTDTSMTFEKNKCKCCGAKENYTAHAQYTFCSYKCFWEWSEKNMPKIDEPPIERLKRYIAPNKYANSMSMVFFRMFGVHPPNKEDILEKSLPKVYKEIIKTYNIGNDTLATTGIDSVVVDKWGRTIEIYVVDINKATPIITDIEKKYSNINFKTIMAIY